MKKTLSIIVLAFAVMMTVLPSCSKPEKQIVGKWEMISLTVDGDRMSCRDAYLTFKDNGSVRLSGIIDGEDLDFSSKWVMDEDELVIKGGDIDFGNEYYILQLEVDELTKETLELRGKIKVYDDEGLDMSVPVRASFERK